MAADSALVAMIQVDPAATARRQPRPQRRDESERLASRRRLRRRLRGGEGCEPREDGAQPHGGEGADARGGVIDAGVVVNTIADQ